MPRKPGTQRGKRGRGRTATPDPRAVAQTRSAAPERDPELGKGERTRRRLLQTSLQLFRDQGFERTTLREIAATAEVSLGLVYRYYESKEALVVELYDQLSLEFVERSGVLPEGPWAVRALHLVELSVDVLAPQREVLRALVPALTVEAGHPLFIPAGQPSHLRVEAQFIRAVREATDAPPDGERLGRRLYLAHLGFVLAWLLDRSPRQQASRRVLEACAAWVTLVPWVVTGPFKEQAEEIGALLELGILGEPERSRTPSRGKGG